MHIDYRYTRNRIVDLNGKPMFWLLCQRNMRVLCHQVRYKIVELSDYREGLSFDEQKGELLKGCCTISISLFIRYTKERMYDAFLNYLK